MKALDFTVFAAYAVGMLFLLLAVRRSRTLRDFAVGSHAIPKAILMASLAATYIGPGYSMGLSDRVAGQGLLWLVVFFAFSAQTILVGLFVAPRMNRFQRAITLGDIMGARYGRLTHLLAGLLSVCLLTGLIGAIGRASGDILGHMTGLDPSICAVSAIALTTAYSLYGGIKADVATDAVQFVILSIAVPCMLVILCFAAGKSLFTAQIPWNTSSFGSLPIIGLFASFFLGETLIPPYAARALAAKDPSSARSAFLVGGAFSVLWFTCCAGIGLASRTLEPNASSGVFLRALSDYMPLGLLGLVVAAIAAIIMSSQDSVLNTGGVAFTEDILRTVNPGIDLSRHGLSLSRYACLAMAALGTVFSLAVPSVVEALLYCYTLWAPTVVLPLVLAVFLKRVNPLSGLLAMIAGGSATALWEWGLALGDRFPSVMIGIVANQAAFWLANGFLKLDLTSPLLVPEAAFEAISDTPDPNLEA